MGWRFVRSASLPVAVHRAMSRRFMAGHDQPSNASICRFAARSAHRRRPRHLGPRFRGDDGVGDDGVQNRFAYFWTLPWPGSGRGRQQKQTRGRHQRTDAAGHRVNDPGLGLALGCRRMMVSHSLGRWAGPTRQGLVARMPGNRREPVRKLPHGSGYVRYYAAFNSRLMWRSTWSWVYGFCSSRTVAAEVAAHPAGTVIAAGQQHRHVGPMRAHPARQADAVQLARHAHVAEHQIDVVRVVHHVDRLMRVAGFQHLIADLPQVIRDRLAHQQVVVHHQQHGGRMQRMQGLKGFA